MCDVYRNGRSVQSTSTRALAKSNHLGLRFSHIIDTSDTSILSKANTTWVNTNSYTRPKEVSSIRRIFGRASKHLMCTEHDEDILNILIGGV